VGASAHDIVSDGAPAESGREAGRPPHIDDPAQIGAAWIRAFLSLEPRDLLHKIVPWTRVKDQLETPPNSAGTLAHTLARYSGLATIKAKKATKSQLVDYLLDLFEASPGYVAPSAGFATSAVGRLSPAVTPWPDAIRSLAHEIFIDAATAPIRSTEMSTDLLGSPSSRLRLRLLLTSLSSDDRVADVLHQQVEIRAREFAALIDPLAQRYGRKWVVPVVDFVRVATCLLDGMSQSWLRSGRDLEEFAGLFAEAILTLAEGSTARG